MPKTSARVKMIGEDGNAFTIIGRVQRALRDVGREDLCQEYYAEATSGDYDHLIQVTMKYVEVY
jgi:hypothetical protein